jgi:hypothetical protein
MASPTMVDNCEDKRDPYVENKAWFAKYHKSCRKDVEQAFGVLQLSFTIVRYPALQWLTAPTKTTRKEYTHLDLELTAVFYSILDQGNQNFFFKSRRKWQKKTRSTLPVAEHASMIPCEQITDAKAQKQGRALL